MANRRDTVNRSSLRTLPWARIVAEGVVIVLSILFAFSIDAWWDGRADRLREDAYLDMLAADLRATLDNNTLFGTRADSTDRALAKLVRAWYRPDLPPDDSIAEWYLQGTGAWVVQPSLGTVQALVSTGDLELIRSQELRAAILEYRTVMTAFEAFEQSGWERFLASRAELYRQVPRVSVLLTRLSVAERDSIVASDEFTTIPAGRLRSLRPPDFVSLVRDPVLHGIRHDMNGGKTEMRANRGRMRQFTEQLLGLVEAARES